MLFSISSHWETDWRRHEVFWNQERNDLLILGCVLPNIHLFHKNCVFQCLSEIMVTQQLTPSILEMFCHVKIPIKKHWGLSQNVKESKGEGYLCRHREKLPVYPDFLHHLVPLLSSSTLLFHSDVIILSYSLNVKEKPSWVSAPSTCPSPKRSHTPPVGCSTST